MSAKVMYHTERINVDQIYEGIVKESTNYMKEE